MGLKLDGLALASREVRKKFDRDGGRQLDFRRTFVAQALGPRASGFWDRIRNAILRVPIVGPWILNSVGRWIQTNLTPGRILTAIYQGATALVRFDWRQSDEELRQNYRAQWEALCAIWGEAEGQGIGRLAGITFGYGVGLICPVIGGSALAFKLATGEVAEEAAEEIIASTLNAINQTFVTILRTALIEGLILSRRGLRLARRTVLEFSTGESAEDIEQAIAQGDLSNGVTRSLFLARLSARGNSKTFFIDQAALLAAEGARVAATRATRPTTNNMCFTGYVAGFFEGLYDAFTESVFIIAGELDRIWNDYLLAKDFAERNNVTVTVEPDLDTDDKIVLSGDPATLSARVTDAVAQFRNIESRDIGDVGFTSQYTELRAPSIQEYRLELTFYSVPRPPWQSRRERRSRARRAVYNVPDAKIGLTWEQIKRACGGTNGYEWGPHYVTATLESGRKIFVYGATQSAAQSRAEALAELSSSGEIISLRAGINLRPVVGGSRAEAKSPTRMYPAKVKVFRKRFVSQGTPNARRSLDGRFYAEEYRSFKLFPDSQPRNLLGPITSPEVFQVRRAA